MKPTKKAFAPTHWWIRSWCHERISQSLVTMRRSQTFRNAVNVDSTDQTAAAEAQANARSSDDDLRQGRQDPPSAEHLDQEAIVAMQSLRNLKSLGVQSVLFPARQRVGRLGFLGRLILISLMGVIGARLVSLGMESRHLSPTDFNPAGFSGAIILTAMVASLACSVIGRARDFGIRPLAALAIFVLLPVAAHGTGSPGGTLGALLLQALMIIALLVVPGIRQAGPTAHNDA